MKNAYRCPACGEPITPFAAGCSYCGVELDPRRDRADSVATRVRRGWRVRRPGVRLVTRRAR